MHRHIRRYLIRLAALLMGLSGCVLLLRGNFYPVIVSLAQTQVRNTASDLINDAIAKQISSGNIRYDRIVYFEKDLSGRITALKTNMGEINRLKTDVLNLINEEVLSADESALGVPLGSLILPELFSGKGPRLPVRILAIRNSDAGFTSAFTEAGINQTMHRLNMEVRLDIAVLILGKAEGFSVSSQVIVAETVIVGDVPQTFLKSGG